MSNTRFKLTYNVIPANSSLLKGAQESGKTYRVISATLPFEDKKNPIGLGLNLLLACWPRKHLRGAWGSQKSSRAAHSWFTSCWIRRTKQI